MHHTQSKPSTTFTLRLFVPLSCLAWMALILLSYFWNVWKNEEQHLAILLQTGRSFFQQIEITREWNASHGGVYVPVRGDTMPNPYLPPALRDLHVNADLLLTKVNPAYMTRQISEVAKSYQNVQFHITSLNPIRPQNEAEPWEQAALRQFEQGLAREVGQVIPGTSVPAFFYMAPLITTKPCLACHQDQGYKEGDIRGGISITIPYAKQPFSLPLATGHFVLGLCGIATVLFLGGRLGKAYQALQNQAVIDALTGIPNRRSFTERILEEANRHKRKQEPLSLLMCDIDNFKAFNDTYGHGAGDECLLKTAREIRRSLRRPGDFCARYGGEEFVIILPSTTLEGAMHVAQSIVANVRNLGIRHEKSMPEGHVTVSIGVATSSSDQDLSHEQLMRQADAALYQAKDGGRNCVRAFS